MKILLLFLLLISNYGYSQSSTDTVKCIVQHWGNFSRSYFTEGGNESAILVLSKGWVVRKIEKRNNAEGKIDPYHDFGFKYQEWLTYTPVKFLFSNKRSEVKNLWLPDGKPQYMLNIWEYERKTN